MSIKDNQGPLWEVFSQTKPGMPFKHAGSVLHTIKIWPSKLPEICLPEEMKGPAYG